MSFESDFSEDECGQFEMCARRRQSDFGLPFDPTSIENIILNISDRFNIRVLMSNERVKGVVMVTTGLAFAGGLLGKAYGGKVGAAVGGALGGVCGLSLAAMSMRSIWTEIKPRLAEVFDLVYDFLAGMGLQDYAKAAQFLMSHSSSSSTLAMMIIQTASQILGKQILSSLTAA